MQQRQVERLFDEPPAHYEEEHFWLFRDFKDALNRGEIRAAEPVPGLTAERAQDLLVDERRSSTAEQVP